MRNSELNSYINITKLDNDNFLLMNKKNGDTYEIGKQEGEVLSLMNGINTPEDISRICKCYTVEEVKLLEEEFKKIGVIGNGKKINFIKMKIPIISPDKIFKNGKIVTFLYRVFMSAMILFVAMGLFFSIKNILCGSDPSKLEFIKSFSLKDIKIADCVVMYFLTVFFSVFHEFGHTIIAKQKNISVPDLGFMLYLFIPCAYANLTMLKYNENKKDNIQALLGGTLSDMGMIGISMALFNYLPLNRCTMFFLFSVLINLVSVFLNMIVFFKFDGYFILENLLSEENIKINSMKSILGFLKKNKEEKKKNIFIVNKNNENILINNLFSFCFLFVSSLGLPLIISSSILPLIINIIKEAF